LKACAEHTRNKDLKSTLSLDFGNFIVLMLDPAEYVAMWHPNGPPPACAICMESLEEPCEIFHRVCEQFVAHPTCFETWAKAGAHFTCPRCKQINWFFYRTEPQKSERCQERTKNTPKNTFRNFDLPDHLQNLSRCSNSILPNYPNYLNIQTAQYAWNPWSTEEDVEPAISFGAATATRVCSIAPSVEPTFPWERNHNKILFKHAGM
jgi:phage FluMu protein Com